jgi:predicted MPP superfamily phosphohydrolase
VNTWVICVSIYDLVENIGLAASLIWLLTRRRPYPEWLVYVIATWATMMSFFFILGLMPPVFLKPILREWFYFPLSVTSVWNLLILQLLFPAIIVVVLYKRWRKPAAVPQPLPPEGLSRRQFLYAVGCGALPAVAIGLGVHGTVTRDDLRVRKFDIPIAGLPPELEGLTIAHVSDLHSGLFVGPRRLRNMSDLTNDLKADLVMVTGDLINREMNEFPAALQAIQRLESRHGMYLCEGNHDVIPGNFLVVNACRRNGLDMLYDESAALHIRGRRLIIGGLPWMAANFEGRSSMVSGLYPERQPGDVRILLAHHPHLFDVADSADLVLSGHTHGGQIMLDENVGLGRLRFKYCSGLFRRSDTTMIVNNGCGDWFPCRIGAPAEVGLLRLTKATA